MIPVLFLHLNFSRNLIFLKSLSTPQALCGKAQWWDTEVKTQWQAVTPPRVWKAAGGRPGPGMRLPTAPERIEESRALTTVGWQSRGYSS